MKRTWIALLALVMVIAGGFTGAAAQGEALQIKDNPDLGSYLATPTGMTLYVFTADTPGTSTCTGDCLINWPPLTGDVTLPDGATGELGSITRDDGVVQVTYNSWPLYTFAADTAEGDVNGQGKGDKWYVISPEGVFNGTPTAPEASPAASPVAGGGVLLANDATFGDFLTDANGMTLYTFDNDTEGVSNCSDDCAANWPPLLVADANAVPALPDGVDGTLTVLARADGTFQVAFDGKPLYLWVGDKAPGDVTGDGVGGVWHVATTTPAS